MPNLLHKTVGPIGESLLARELCIFCGAGISFDPPSRAPLWDWLRDAYLKAFCNDVEVPGEISRVLPKKWLDAKPEVMCSILYDTLGLQFFDSLKVLRAGEPNENHYSIAKCARAGKLPIVLTTNFDEYIEGALDKLGSINIARQFNQGSLEDFVALVASDPNTHFYAVFLPEASRELELREPKNAIPMDVFDAMLSDEKDIVESWLAERKRETQPPPTYTLDPLVGVIRHAAKLENLTTLVKLHGTISYPESIIATLADAAKPLPAVAQESLAELLGGYSMLFVGYSGRDHDIYPFLLRCSEEGLVRGRIYWIFGPGSTEPRAREPHVYDFLERVPSKETHLQSDALRLFRAIESTAGIHRNGTEELVDAGFAREDSHREDLEAAEKSIFSWVRSIRPKPTLQVREHWLEAPGYPSKEWRSTALLVIQQLLASAGLYRESNEVADLRNRLETDDGVGFGRFREADVDLRLTKAQNLLKLDEYPAAVSLAESIKKDLRHSRSGGALTNEERAEFRCQASVIMGRALRKMGEQDLAKKEFDSVLEYGTSNADEFFVSIASINKALLDATKADFQTTLGEILKHSEVLHNVGAVNEYVESLEEIARLYYSLGRYARSKEYLRTALYYRRSLGDPVALADNLLFLVRVLSRENSVSEIKLCSRELERLARYPEIEKKIAEAKLVVNNESK